MTATKRHILIAEDEKPVAKALALKLEHEGYTVTIVENGKEALQKIAAGGFDCMVLDLMMPVMDGFEVLQELQEKQATLPILVASNLAQAEDMERAKSLGAKDYYVKSDTPLTTVVEQIKKMSQ
jgi:two-component system response regulator ResD